MTAPTTIARSIKELREYDGPLYIANNTRKRIHCHEVLGDNRVDFELEPKGEPDSVMMIPKLALEVRGVQKAWRNGDIIVSTDDAMEEQIALLDSGTRSSLDRLNQIVSQSGDNATVQIESSANNKALVQKACLECGAYDQRTGVITRGRVVQSLVQEKAGEPPLCPAHTGLVTQFTPRPVLEADGTQRWEFDRVQLTGIVHGEPKI